MSNPKAAAYIRMSTTKQEDSPAVQKANILAKFADKYDIVIWYQDLGKSGSKDKELRTQFLAMLKDSTKSAWKTILCNNPARLTREDTIEAATDKKVLRDNGITVMTVSHGAMDWTTFTGRIVDAVQAEAENQYPITLAKNTLDGKIKKAKDGKSYGQTTPYGFARLIKDSLGHEFVVDRTTRYTKPKDAQSVFICGDEEEVSTLQWIYSEFVRRDVSFHQLAKELNEKGIKSPNGKSWVYQVVHELLRNPRYVGDLTLGRRSSGRFYRVGADATSVEQSRKTQMTTNRTPAVHIRSTHKGIIERDVFDTVQRKLKRRERSRQHSGREGGFALTGVIVCGRCGKPMYGNERRDPKRHRVGIKYSCKGWHRSFESGCGQWMVHQDDVLPILLDVVCREIDDKLLTKIQARPPIRETGNSESIEKKLTKLKVDYASMINRFLKLPAGHPAESDLDAAIRVQKAAITELEKELAKPVENLKAVINQHHEFWGTVRDRLICIQDHHFVPTGRPNQGFAGGFGRLVRERPATPEAIREVFHTIGLKLTLWFARGAKSDGSASKKWVVKKARLTADSGILEPTEHDSLASLIV